MRSRARLRRTPRACSAGRDARATRDARAPGAARSAAEDLDRPALRHRSEHDPQGRLGCRGDARRSGLGDRAGDRLTLFGNPREGCAADRGRGRSRAGAGAGGSLGGLGRARCGRRRDACRREEAAAGSTDEARCEPAVPDRNAACTRSARRGAGDTVIHRDGPEGSGRATGRAPGRRRVRSGEREDRVPRVGEDRRPRVPAGLLPDARRRVGDRSYRAGRAPSGAHRTAPLVRGDRGRFRAAPKDDQARAARCRLGCCGGRARFGPSGRRAQGARRDARRSRVRCDRARAAREAMKLLAPAKVNPFLTVGARGPDGLHEIESVMQAVSLFDSVTLAPSDAFGVTGSPAGAAPEDDSNLALRAARAFAELQGGSGVSIAIEKRIPVAAGLGGGSADAAATLVGLNGLLDTRVSKKALEKMAAGLGADVPFCVRGGTAAARGVGENLSVLPCPTPVWWILGISGARLSTADVYEEFDRLGGGRVEDPYDVADALARADVERLASALRNDLERAALSLAPQIRTGRDALGAAGALGVILAGSGPTWLGF